MRPTFVPNYVVEDLFPILRNEVPWVNRAAPRDECFMAEDTSLTYSYGNNNETRETLHTYNAVPMHPSIRMVMFKLNTDFDCQYNVCVLNYYKDQHQHLGWHADDSPEQDLQHPIAEITFGAERYLFIKDKKHKGDVPEENKFLLTRGSLFVMPGGFQDLYYHKIPKHSAPCEGRISLTFRKLDR